MEELVISVVSVEKKDKIIMEEEVLTVNKTIIECEMIDMMTETTDLKEGNIVEIEKENTHQEVDPTINLEKDHLYFLNFRATVQTEIENKV